jgi:hypothetical protein
MVARSDWGVGKIHQKGISHTLSEGQSSIGLDGTRTAGWLVFLNGAHRGEDLRLKVGESKIGSSWMCDLVVTGVGIGSDHAMLFATETNATIKPQSLGREVLVNNERIEEIRELADGDLLTFGDLHAVYRCAAEFSPGYIPKEYVKPARMPVQGAPKILTCGWLLVTKGVLSGQDFRLVSGRSQVGSKIGIEICIPDQNFSDIAFELVCTPSGGSISFIKEGRGLKINGALAELNVSIRDSDVLALDQMEFLVKWY